MEKLGNFNEWLNWISTRLLTEERWQGQLLRNNESVLEHTFKISFIVQVMLAIERKYGNQQALNFYQLLQCANNHDLGRASLNGDEDEDQDKTEVAIDEKAAFQMVLKEGLPSWIQRYFPLPIDHDSQVDKSHHDFWQAAMLIKEIYCLLEGDDTSSILFKREMDRKMRNLRQFTELKSVEVFFQTLHSWWLD